MRGYEWPPSGVPWVMRTIRNVFRFPLDRRYTVEGSLS